MGAPAASSLLRGMPSPYGGAIGSAYAQVGNRPGPSRPERIISRFQPGHGWFQAGGHGAIADDVANYALGAQSLRITTGGDAADFARARKTSISPLVDVSGSTLRVWLHVDNPARVQNCLLYLSSDNFATNYVAAELVTENSSAGAVVAGEWRQMTISRSGFNSTAGTTNLSAINAAQLAVRDVGTGPVSVRINAVETQAEPEKGYLSITFDDEWSSAWENAVPIMDGHGLAGSMFVIADLVGETGYMTLPQLQALEERGWEVQSHSAKAAEHNLPNGLPDLSEYRKASAVTEMRHWIAANGFRGASGFAYPQGKHDAALRAQIRKGYAWARTTNSYGWETLPPADPYRIRAHQVLPANTTADIGSWIDRCIADRSWLILVFHKVVDTPTPGDDLAWATSDFEAAMADIATRSRTELSVMPMGDVVNEVTR